MDYIKSNKHFGICRVFNTPGNVCPGSDWIDKTRWCYHCACYHPSESNEEYDDIDTEYEEFKKWYEENEWSFHCAQMNDKEVAYAAWCEGMKRGEMNFIDGEDTASWKPKKIGKCKIRIVGEKKPWLPIEDL